MNRPQRVECECGRIFVTESGKAECPDCAEYRSAGRHSWKSDASVPFLPPMPGFDPPRRGPWTPDDGGGGVA